MVQWFLKEMETEQVQKERKPEDTFDLYLRKTPPGNEGLVLYPYWGASAKYPLSSGTLMGFRDYHGKEHLYRAIIEGINYTLRWAVERMEQKKKSRIERVKVTGGGAESETIWKVSGSGRLYDASWKSVSSAERDASGVRSDISGIYQRSGEADSF